MAFLDWEVHHVNVIAAYLHGPLEEDIYMVISDGIEGSGSGCFWKLRKALYGLKQAGRQWKKHLHDTLIDFGFTRAFADDCLYIKRHEGKIVLLILVYIDNMAVAGPGIFYITSFKSFLNKNFEITDLGDLSYMLGVLVTRDHQNRLIYLNQAAYIQ